MNDKKQMRLSALLSFILLAVLISPIFIYIRTFGYTISTNHARWAEMGAAMTGIYSPIFAYLAYLVLYRQFELQQQINNYQSNQILVQEARSAIHYYLQELDQGLNNKLDSGLTIREFLHSNFDVTNLDLLTAKEIHESSIELEQNYPKIRGMWEAMYPYLEGLQSISELPHFVHNFKIAKHNAIAMLSFKTCITLDNYLWCVSKLRFKYQYSPLLNNVTLESAQPSEES